MSAAARAVGAIAPTVSLCACLSLLTGCVLDENDAPILRQGSQHVGSAHAVLLATTSAPRQSDIAASPLYMDVELAPGFEWQFPVPVGHTLITYVFEGEGVFSGETVDAVKMVRFGDGDHITIQTENSPVRFMLIAGAPFKEPIVPYGPFVMNTIEEIQETLKELRNGTFIKE